MFGEDKQAHRSIDLKPGAQSGTALVMAMLIIALVTATVVATTWKFELGMSRNENRWHGLQGRSYLKGVEEIAKKVLLEDLKENGEVDHFGDIWAQMGAQELPTDEGWVRGALEDAQGRFNLNSLRDKFEPPPPGSGEPQPTADDYFTESHKQFIRLLQTISLEDGVLSTEDAKQLTRNISNWVDADNDPFPGAFSDDSERNYYNNLEFPMHISNGDMDNVSELRVVKGITPELYQKLLPYVSALPNPTTAQSQPALLNINTMPSLFFRILNTRESFEPLFAEDVEAVLEQRSELGHFGSKDEITSSLPQGVILDGVSVKSDFFYLTAETMVGRQIRREKSLLQRAGNKVDILRRSTSKL